MWIVNMIFCCAIGFGGFAYAIYMMAKADERKRAERAQKTDPRKANSPGLSHPA